MKPWESEPDLVDGGYMRIVRHPSQGHLCGYVEVTNDHPWFGLSYDDDELYDVHVHGGLTFAGSMQHFEVFNDENEKDRWWFGFDCAHSGDLVPSISGTYCDEYRDIDYVSKQVAKLATQILSAMER